MDLPERLLFVSMPCMLLMILHVWVAKSMNLPNYIIHPALWQKWLDLGLGILGVALSIVVSMGPIGVVGPMGQMGPMRLGLRYENVCPPFWRQALL